MYQKLSPDLFHSNSLKIVEMLPKTELIDYLETASAFSKCRFGCRSNKSAVDALLTVMKELIDGLENYTTVLSCSLWKAVDVGIYICKYGIPKCLDVCLY